MSARPITDPEELAKRCGAQLLSMPPMLVKRKYTLHHNTGVWAGWRDGNPAADDLIGDYLFVYADTDGFLCTQTLSHEFVTQYPAYLPDGDWPSTVEEWWLGEALKLKEAQQ
jgi:hypothetical protein